MVEVYIIFRFYPFTECGKRLTLEHDVGGFDFHVHEPGWVGVIEGPGERLCQGDDDMRRQHASLLCYTGKVVLGGDSL